MCTHQFRSFPPGSLTESLLERVLETLRARLRSRRVSRKCLALRSSDETAPYLDDIALIGALRSVVDDVLLFGWRRWQSWQRRARREALQIAIRMKTSREGLCRGLNSSRLEFCCCLSFASMLSARTGKKTFFFVPKIIWRVESRVSLSNHRCLCGFARSTSLQFSLSIFANPSAKI